LTGWVTSNKQPNAMQGLV